VIGWYVHHVGRGHLHHALAIAEQLAEPVTALSSLQRPAEWRDDWIQLARDDEGTIAEPDAHGAFHWAPVRHSGLRDRMATVAAWIAAARPRALVIDVSVEVAALARLFGVPVITFCLPGVRTDAPHRLAWDLADAIIAPWPQRHPGLCVGLEGYRDKVCFTGAISRFAGRPRLEPRAGRHGVVLGGLGGSALRAPDVPGWAWTVLDGRTWCQDPWPLLCSAEVVITHAGLAAVADVAAARAPALVVPQERPFGEQVATATALDLDGLAMVVGSASADWPRLVDETVACGGAGWLRWSDGRGASRAAAGIAAVADRSTYSWAS
jgi:hypothetical protein